MSGVGDVDDVVLVNVNFYGIKEIREPLGIALLAAILRQEGRRVRLVDPTIDGGSLDATVDAAMAHPARIAGLSVHADQTKSLDEAAGLVRGLRQRGFSGPACLGGYGVSLRFRDYLERIPDAVVVVGDGEAAFPEVVRRLLLGRGAAETGLDVPGVAWRPGGGAVRCTPARRVTSLDDFPAPARDLLLPRLGRHGRRAMSYVRAGSGCHHQCSYCSMDAYLRLMDGRRYLKRAVPRIVDEIAGLANELGVENFTLLDENFIVKTPAGLERLRALRDELLRRGLEVNLHVQTRPDSISAPAVDMLKQAGMKSIFIGIEAVHPHDLRIYNRTGSGGAARALATLQSRGYGVDIYSDMRCHVGFIGFHPFSTAQALKASVRFFQRHRIPPKRLLQRLRVQDHTRIRDLTAAAGLLRMAHHSSYQDRREAVFDYLHPEVGDIYDIIQRLMAEFYGWRERLRRVEKCLRFAPESCAMGELAGVSAAIDALMLDILYDLCQRAEDEPDFRQRVEDHCRRARGRLAAFMRERDVASGVAVLEGQLKAAGAYVDADFFL